MFEERFNFLLHVVLGAIVDFVIDFLFDLAHFVVLVRSLFIRLGCFLYCRLLVVIEVTFFLVTISTGIVFLVRHFSVVVSSRTFTFGVCGIGT